MATKKPTRGKSKKKQKKIKIFKVSLTLKDIILWILVSIIVVSLFAAFQDEATKLPNKPLSTVVADMQNGLVEKVTIEDPNLTITYKSGEEFSSIKEPQASFFEILAGAGIDSSTVDVEIVDTAPAAALWAFLGNLIPSIIFIGFLLFLFRQARGAQDSIFSFGKSNAKRYNKHISKTTFKDVAGVDEAKKELEEVVDFLKHPKKYHELGARTPKGVLLVGPAGTGKTLLAKAVAGEAGVPFFSMAGSEFMEMLVGVGAKRVRDLFSTAKKQQPAIIFIDEIDAIGRRRSTGYVGGHDEREQTLNQILVEMDGFDPRTNVIIIAATNRGDLLDSALLRPGRFDRRIVLEYPDMEGRKFILKIHARGKPFHDDVDWDKVSRRTVGFSGADIENMLNEAAIQAARGNKKAIDMIDIEEAATKVKLGPEKKRLQSDEDRKMTAYHEAGHALVTHALDHADSVHRVSIVSRGMALGYTMVPPEKDRTHETKSHLLDRIAMMMGGRAAEEIVFKEVTSGASNDFDQATNIARLMVEEFGMSKLGPMNFGPTKDITNYGAQFFDQSGISPAMQERIDIEVKRILDEAYKKAKDTLTSHRKQLDLIAQELLKKETIEGDEFEKLMKKSTS